MSYKHFAIEERCCLREFYKKGYSYRKIAELIRFLIVLITFATASLSKTGLIFKEVCAGVHVSEP